MEDQRWGQWAVWAFLASWVGVALVGGGELGEALATRSTPVRMTATALLWTGWTAGALAAALPRSITLTVVRAVAPAGLLATAWAAIAGEGSAAGSGVAALAVALAFLPDTGGRFVQGSAYGDERRYPLRPPPALVAGPVPAAWVAVAAGLVGPPLLLAARQWVAGALSTAVAVPLVFLAGRALHGLSRRWVVFVPAGMVLHDTYTLDEPVLFPRRLVARLGPATVDTDALDLTAGAVGLPLELALRENVPLVLAPTGWRRRGAGETGRVGLLIFTPTRPGRVLATARARRLPVA